MRFSIPIEPDAETARRWLEDELSKSQYQERPAGWFQRLQQWINDFINRLFSIGEEGSALGVNGGVVVGILIAVAALVVLALVLGPLRRSRARAKSAAVFDDDDREATDIREAALAAASRQDWTLAVLERFRALVRAVEERGLVSVVPGMTAAEFAVAVGTRLEVHQNDLQRCADIFDGVRYGHDQATRELYEYVARIDDAVAQSRVGVKA
jgi:hypothetical protein